MNLNFSIIAVCHNNQLNFMNVYFLSNCCSAFLYFSMYFFCPNFFKLINFTFSVNSIKCSKIVYNFFVINEYKYC